MIIKVLGSGCAKCKLLEQVTKEAVRQLWIDAEILKIQDMEAIMAYDIMATPALVRDEVVISTGRVPNIDELKTFLQ